MRVLSTLLLTAALATTARLALAQATLGGVRIGTAGTPDASAVLELAAPGKGLLIPRLDSVARVGIAAPATGLLVFQTSPRVGFYYYGGSGWLFLPDKTRGGDNLGNGIATTTLNLRGNALVGTGDDLGTVVGVGVRADGGLNLGQNNAGNNVLLGYQAGAAATTGSRNQFTGYQSGSGTTTGFDNLFSGYQSGTLNTTGIENQFIGYRSGYSNTTASRNQFSGFQSGLNNTTGYQNQFSGFQSGANNTTGFANHFSGYQSGSGTTTGFANQFSGYQSGYHNATGNNNQFSGYQSGFYNTTGQQNQFSGYQSGYTAATSFYNQFSGYQSGYSTTSGSRNQFSGYQSGYRNTTGEGNQFSGYQSGYNTTTGLYNQFGGYQSGYSATTGFNNQFSGYQSGYNTTTGSNNHFSGFQSGFYNITGSGNWAFGYQAGPTTGSLTNAGALGYQAQVSQSNALVLGGTGANAVQVGIGTPAPRGVLDVASSGDLYLVADPANGNSQTTYLPGHLFLAPYNASDPTAYVQARVPSPTSSTSLALQFRTTNNGSLVNALRLNPSGSATFAGNVTANGVTLTSDARLKTAVRPLGGALAAVQRLRGVRYRWNALGVAHGGQAGTEQLGLLAQELEAVYPELVRTDEQGYKSVNYAQLTPVLLEAIKELATQNATLRAQVAGQQASQQADHAALLSLQTQLAQLGGGGASAGPPVAPAAR